AREEDEAAFMAGEGQDAERQAREEEEAARRAGEEALDIDMDEGEKEEKTPDVDMDQEESKRKQARKARKERCLANSTNLELGISEEKDERKAAAATLQARREEPRTRRPRRVGDGAKRRTVEISEEDALSLLTKEAQPVSIVGYQVTKSPLGKVRRMMSLDNSYAGIGCYHSLCLPVMWQTPRVCAVLSRVFISGQVVCTVPLVVFLGGSEQMMVNATLCGTFPLIDIYIPVLT
ncbi:MAG: uncharacterized protein A8A55_2917, partial [Amphiamblys sp. WSBS2006]